MASSDFENLKERICRLQDVTIANWQDTDLICVFYKDKEIAHFHGETILDIRLTPKIIKDEGLTREISAQIHPNRSPKSRWIGIGCTTESETQTALKMIERASNI